ncbi:Mitochondrial import receptor subunit TOM7 [Galemys pyrenaicus]|uniref:Mitochondrial import receptor subunit TOM7 homolog n=1 Tax=Galemys pyrenaicus TaxID=202257 RepID=A0A8J6DNI8_GALPY|nr:Mitochondrial import receptor subunit TOM7 [Galemys pyrenaicus]
MRRLLAEWGQGRLAKGDELRPLLATRTTPAVKEVCGACAPRQPFGFLTRVVAVASSRCAVPAVTMVKLSKEAKQRLQQLFKGGQFAIRWGFIPLVIYLGQWEKKLGDDWGRGWDGGCDSIFGFQGVEEREPRCANPFR